MTSSLSVGASLRFKYLDEVKSDITRYSFFELLVDNILHDSEDFYNELRDTLSGRPVFFHSVGMNLGSASGIDLAYLDIIGEMIAKFQPIYVSDHLAWTGIENTFSHDLLPLPYTEESLEFLCRNIETVQKHLGITLSIENPSTYVSFKEDSITEPDFLKKVCEQTQCELLLDINNVVVNSFNHGLDQTKYLNTIKDCPISYMHIAGHDTRSNHLFDSHSKAPSDETLNLYKESISIFGKKPVLLEWDQDLPDYSIYCQQIDKIKNIYEGAS